MNPGSRCEAEFLQGLYMYVLSHKQESLSRTLDRICAENELDSSTAFPPLAMLGFAFSIISLSISSTLAGGCYSPLEKDFSIFTLQCSNVHVHTCMKGRELQVTFTVQALREEKKKSLSVPLQPGKSIIFTNRLGFIQHGKKYIIMPPPIISRDESTRDHTLCHLPSQQFLTITPI